MATNGKVLALNKKAKADYNFLEIYEAGIKLTGPEVKACKLGQVNLKGSYAVLNEKGRPYLLNCHISPYKPAKGVQQGYDPERSRPLLLRAKEIRELTGRLQEKGLSFIPVSVIVSNGLIKVELALGRGKKQYEKRETIKKRDTDREIRRLLKK